MISEEKAVKLAGSANLGVLFANQDDNDFSGIWFVLMV